MSQLISLACPLFLVGLGTLFGPADDGAEQMVAARKQRLRGHYEEAIDAYAKLASDKQWGAAAAVGVSLCHEATGHWDEAAAAVADSLQQFPADPDLLARRADLALARGSVDVAKANCEQALQQKPDHLLARWVLVRVDDATGQSDAARRGIESLVQSYNRSTVKDPDALTLLGQAAVEHAARNMRGREQSQQLGRVLNEIFDTAAADPDFWPALYYSGRLFLEKHRKGDALKDLRRALAINPSAAEIHVMLGLVALEDYEIEDGHTHADRALALNANLPAARQLKADLYMAREQYAEAMEELKLALTVNPVDEESLGRMAACLWLTRRAGEFDQLRNEVQQRNPRPSQFLTRLAERLEDHRRFDVAEQYFREAIEAAPDRGGPRTGLGMLYMRVGKEDVATTTLEKAFEMDPFNARTKNMLEVLDQLKGYETIETDHFRIRCDAELDGMLGRYAARYLEEVYAELTERFAFQPEGLIQIEIFNKGRGDSAHRWFSARTVGLPWIGTVGACTGKVVAMASPRGVERPFNWARVLKHEVTHVITLQQTRFNIPHWYTEALAVQAEGYPRPQLWNQLLVERVPAGTLLNLDNINLAFARPKTQLDWQMAYCQSELYAEYMQQRFGPKITARLLDAYREGLATAEAIPSVCGISLADFEAAYREYLRSVAGGLQSGPTETPMSRAELERAVVAEPTNPEFPARLAGEYLKQRNYPKAREWALKATQLQEHHPLGSFMLARLFTLVGDNSRAREVLEPALNREHPDPRVLELLANMLVQAKEYDAADGLYHLGRKFFPTESKWIAGVARIALITDNRQALRDALEALCLVDADDPSPRRKLASMAAEDADWNRAQRYAWMTLHIDVADVEAITILADSLAAQKQWPLAADEYRAVVKLRPDDPAARIKLAKSLRAAGDSNAAIGVVKELLEKDPKNAEARELFDEWNR
jgi:tetratricopeptide (TPR) repeat protein